MCSVEPGQRFGRRAFSQLPHWVTWWPVYWSRSQSVAVASAGPYICKSAPCSRQITTPASHRSSFKFLQAECPFCCPTKSVKALKPSQNTALRFWYKVYQCISKYIQCGRSGRLGYKNCRFTLRLKNTNNLDSLYINYPNYSYFWVFACTF